MEVRKHFIKTYIWSILMYGRESWTITAVVQKRLEAMEMRCYKRMMKVKRGVKVTNKEVLRGV
jgi:hypothetical protein